MTTSITAKRVRLARAIERDILRPVPKPQISLNCFTCGRTYCRGDGRFCSGRCRAAFDAGLPPFDPDYASKTNPRWYSLPIGPTGFLIDCAHCRKRFDSRGWKYCSTECKRAGHRKEELEVELAGDPFRAVKRKCTECGGDIPNWRNGRRVSKATRFCSRKCRDGARQGKAGFTSRNDEKVPVLSASGGDR